MKCQPRTLTSVLRAALSVSKDGLTVKLLALSARTTGQCCTGNSATMVKRGSHGLTGRTALLTATLASREALTTGASSLTPGKSAWRLHPSLHPQLAEPSLKAPETLLVTSLSAEPKGRTRVCVVPPDAPEVNATGPGLKLTVLMAGGTPNWLHGDAWREATLEQTAAQKGRARM